MSFFLVCKKCGTRMFDTKLDGLLGGVCWRKGSLAFFFLFFFLGSQKVYQVYDIKINGLFGLIIR